MGVNAICGDLEVDPHWRSEVRVNWRAIAEHRSREPRADPILEPAAAQFLTGCVSAMISEGSFAARLDEPGREVLIPRVTWWLAALSGPWQDGLRRGAVRQHLPRRQAPHPTVDADHQADDC